MSEPSDVLVLSPREAAPQELLTVEAEALVTAVHEPVDASIVYMDAEIASAWAQERCAVSLHADAVIRGALVLEQLDACQGYQALGYPSLEAYVRQRHGMSKTLARERIRAVRALGEQECKRILADFGQKRLFLAAHLRQLDSPEWEALFAPECGTALQVPLASLEATVVRLAAERDAAARAQAQLTDQLAAQQQHCTRLDDLLTTVRAEHQALGEQFDVLQADHVTLKEKYRQLRATRAQRVPDRPASTSVSPASAPVREPTPAPTPQSSAPVMHALLDALLQSVTMADGAVIPAVLHGCAEVLRRLPPVQDAADPTHLALVVALQEVSHAYVQYAAAIRRG